MCLFLFFSLSPILDVSISFFFFKKFIQLFSFCMSHFSIFTLLFLFSLLQCTLLCLFYVYFSFFRSFVFFFPPFSFLYYNQQRFLNLSFSTFIITSSFIPHFYRRHDRQHNNTQHNDTELKGVCATLQKTLSTVPLNITTLCHYAVWCVLFVILLNVIILSVIILSVIILSDIILSVIKLCVVMLNVVTLSVDILNVVMLSVDIPNVVMLSVMAKFKCFFFTFFYFFPYVCVCFAAAI